MLRKRGAQDLNYLSTPEEVEVFAIEGNHLILYRCIQNYRAGKITWDQAMQLAAVSQAAALGEETSKQVMERLNESKA